MAKSFIERTRDLKRPRDMDKITREFFRTSEGAGRLHERLLCSGSYHYISRRITNEIMSETWGADGREKHIDPYVQNIIMTFVSQSTIEIYKQWVADGKKLTPEEIIALTTKLVCNGVNGLEHPF